MTDHVVRVLFALGEILRRIVSLVVYVDETNYGDVSVTLSLCACTATFPEHG